MGKLSIAEFCEKLHVARTTAEKWILQGKVKFRSFKVGKRTFYQIDEKEADRLKTSMAKKREKGKPLFKSK